MEIKISIQPYSQQAAIKSDICNQLNTSPSLGEGESWQGQRNSGKHQLVQIQKYSFQYFLHKLILALELGPVQGHEVLNLLQLIPFYLPLISLELFMQLFQCDHGYQDQKEKPQVYFKIVHNLHYSSHRNFSLAPVKLEGLPFLAKPCSHKPSKYLWRTQLDHGFGSLYRRISHLTAFICPLILQKLIQAQHLIISSVSDIQIEKFPKLNQNLMSPYLQQCIYLLHEIQEESMIAHNLHKPSLQRDHLQNSSSHIQLFRSHWQNDAFYRTFYPPIRFQDCNCVIPQAYCLFQIDFDSACL